MLFWRFFGRHEDDAVQGSPLDRIAPNSSSWAYAGHFTGIKHLKRENTSISRLPLFRSLEQLLAVFRPARRRRCPALTLGPNCTKLGFLGLLHAIAQESSVGNGKLPVLADWPGFGAFLALFRPARRRRYPALTPGPNCIKLVFLGLCRPFHRNLALERRKYQY